MGNQPKINAEFNKNELEINLAGTAEELCLMTCYIIKDISNTVDVPREKIQQCIEIMFGILDAKLETECVNTKHK